MQLPEPAAYLEAMAAHGGHIIPVEMTFPQLTIVVGSLQLALRHPTYPAHLRAAVEAFIAEAITNVSRVEPVIGQVMQTGNDPAHKIAYLEAMAAHDDHEIRIEMTLYKLSFLVGSLQLALRHPDYPVALRAAVEALIEGVITTIAPISPVIGQVMEAGNDPAQDF